MAIYTRRLYGGRIDTVGWVPLYSTPSSGTVVLRDLVVTNQTGAVMTAFQLAVFTLAKTLPYWLYMNTAVPIGTLRIDLRQALGPSELLQCYSAEPDYSIAVTGYVFPT